VIQKELSTFENLLLSNWQMDIRMHPIIQLPLLFFLICWPFKVAHISTTRGAPVIYELIFESVQFFFESICICLI